MKIPILVPGFFLTFSSICLGDAASNHLAPKQQSSFEHSPEEMVENLKEALRIPTISANLPHNGDEFQRFHRFLETHYPLVHQHMRKRVVNAHSLVFNMEGTDPSLDPLLFIAHMDVVPVGDQKWTQDPFGGHEVDGVIYGRGAIDMKSNLIGIMEAMEGMLAKGERLERGVYFSFSHDEEVGGKEGNAVISEELREQGVHFAAIIDEVGGVMQEGALSGLNKKKIAMVGVAQKSIHLVEITAEGNAEAKKGVESSSRQLVFDLEVQDKSQGHGSTPPINGGVVVKMARYLQSLERMDWPDGVTLFVTEAHSGIAGNVQPTAGTLQFEFHFKGGAWDSKIVSKIKNRVSAAADKAFDGVSKLDMSHNDDEKVGDSVLHDSVLRLADYIDNVAKRPMPIQMISTVDQQYGAIAKVTSRAVAALLWMRNVPIIGPVIQNLLANLSPLGNAFFRNTTAFTILKAGGEAGRAATLTINFRVLPGQGKEAFYRQLDQAQAAIAGRFAIQENLSSPLTTENENIAASPAFLYMQHAVSTLWGGNGEKMEVAPSLMPGTNDTRYFVDMSDVQMSYYPVTYTKPEDTGLIHGADERIAASDFLKGVQLFGILLRAGNDFHVEEGLYRTVQIGRRSA